MTKSPNTNSKKHRQARNCLRCDNGDWAICRNSQCICKYRSRAASKVAWKKDVLGDLQYTD